MYYIIIAKSFISGTFTDRQTGKSLDYSGWRIVAEEWHDGAKNPGAVKLFKLHKDCDAAILNAVNRAFSRHKPLSVAMAFDYYRRLLQVRQYPLSGLHKYLTRGGFGGFMALEGT